MVGKDKTLSDCHRPSLSRAQRTYFFTKRMINTR